MTDFVEYPFPAELRGERLIALDIETTGLSLKYNTIIELGTIEVVNGREVTRHSRLFGGGYSSMYLIRNIHKIKDAERIGRRTFKEQAEKIASYLSGASLVTHNGNRFDIPMIQHKLAQCGQQIKNFKVIDTYSMARKIGHESNSLANLCKQYYIRYGGENLDKSHRGLEDAEATLQLLYCLMSKKADKMK